MSELEVRAICDGEKEALLEVLCAAFPDDPAATWRRVIDGLWGDFEHTRVGVVDGRVVSTVQIFQYPMRIDAKVFVTGAIAHVATKPGAGGSYAGRVLADAMHVMEREGFSLSVLVTNIPRYYNRHGWWLVPERGFRIDFGEATFGETKGVTVERFDRTRHLDAAAQLHHEASVRLNGTTPREREAWLTSPPWEPDDEARWLVALRAGKVAGYVRGRAASLHIVSELAAADEGAALALLGRLADAAREGGEAHLRGKFPLDSSVARALREKGCRVEEEFPCGPDEDFEITMMRFMDLGKFFRQMEEVLSKRAAHARYGGSAKLAILSDSGAVAIAVTNGKVTTSPQPQSGAEELKVKDAALVELVLGTRTPAELGVGRDLSPAAREMLDAIFPKRDFVLWLPDHF
ncbi:MAG: GNAT family N-acetyltransferase [Planctomycetota bacterium]